MKKIFAVVFVMIAIVGCTKQGNTQATVSDGNGQGDVALVILNDGTKCAVIVGYSKGGIDCNWNGK